MIEFKFELNPRYMEHLKDKSRYNHNYYKLDLSCYGDLIMPRKCDVLYEKCEDDDFYAYYSLGYFEDGKFVYKNKEGEVIEAIVLDMFRVCGDLEIYTLEDNEIYTKYHYDTDNDMWYKYKPNPKDRYDAIAEPFEEEVIDFWFTTRLLKNENK